MLGLEVCLIVIGIVVVVCSYIFSEQLQNKDKNTSEGYVSDGANQLSQVDISAITEEVVRQQVDIAVDDMLEDAVEKTEIVLDKLTNEKIMAVNEYSDGVLGEINKNHSEVMFLYNMLNDKEKSIKDTVREVEAVKRSIKQLGGDTVAVSQAAMLTAGESSQGTASTEQGDDEELRQIMENGFGNQLTDEYEEIVGNHNEEIMMMYQQGYNNLEIAKQLGLGMGEVRLVIDLYKDRM